MTLLANLLCHSLWNLHSGLDLLLSIGGLFLPVRLLLAVLVDLDKLHGRIGVEFFAFGGDGVSFLLGARLCLDDSLSGLVDQKWNNKVGRFC